MPDPLPDKIIPMQILIVRHAIAGDKKKFAASGKPDGLRPLTKKGRKEMKKNLRGLLRLLPSIGTIMTSPLVRARETARILERGYPGARVVVHAGLSPGASKIKFAQWLRRTRPNGVVALVGHEPDLSVLAGRLLANRDRSFVRLKKGGACFLDGELQWLLTPSMLRRLR